MLKYALNIFPSLTLIALAFTQMKHFIYIQVRKS
jgi:hypothetical protein